MADTAFQVEQLKQRYRAILLRAEGHLGKWTEEVDNGNGGMKQYDPIASIVRDLRGGGPAHLANYLHNRDYFRGLERDDPTGVASLFSQLEAVPQAARDLVEEELAEVEKLLTAIERKHSKTTFC